MSADHVEHFVVALDKTHLDIQHRDFGYVAGGGAQLGTEGRANLKHPLEDTDHDLLVELRALGQCGFFAEVIEFEYFGAAFGSPSQQFWRVDFNEIVVGQKFTDVAQQLARILKIFCSCRLRRSTPGNQTTCRDYRLLVERFVDLDRRFIGDRHQDS